MAKTLVQKILDAHTILEEGGRSLIYIDRLIAADTALVPFKTLEAEKIAVRRPRQALLIPDHYTPTAGHTLADVVDDEKRDLIARTEDAGAAAGVDVFKIGDRRRGIQHVVSTEQGFAQPGIVIVAGDSHTATQGAVGAVAFSIGSDLAHVLATQCFWFKKPKTMRIRLDGALALGVTAKDVALKLVASIGTSGAAGHSLEFAGEFIRNLSMEGRMTICNMSIELGARLGIIAPDEKTIEYISGRPYAPGPRYWEQAVAFWRTLYSDSDAVFDREFALNVGEIEPMVTWGTSTAYAVPISGRVPDPADEADDDRRAEIEKSLDYMGLTPGTNMTDIAVDQVFIGSCTNSRIEDLRAAADILRDRTVVVPTLIVPGSGLVKAQAEAEGLEQVFLSAGASWGESGCSMCVSMNGDTVPPGERCVSTSNRNHVGRQGRGSRTHLVSPAMAAAAALNGKLTDIRTWGN